MAGLALLLWSTLPAGAQASTTLVSNLGNDVTAYGNNTFDHAQAFTTGPNSSGYTLTSLSLVFRALTNFATTHLGYEIEIWSASAQGLPSAKTATLLKPGALNNGENTYNTSGSGVWLAASTTYFVVWNVTRRDDGLLGENGQLTETSTLSQTGEAGWEIANKDFTRPWNASAGTAWTEYSNVSYRIRVTGYQGRPPGALNTEPPPDPSNLARGDVQWEPIGGMHPVPAQIGEISSNKPSDASASIDLNAIAASVREELRERSRGFYVTTLVESPGERQHMLRNLGHELARGSPLLKVSIWHIYRRASTGINTIELLGEVFLPRRVNLLVEPVEICLPAPEEGADRARIAVRGRTDSDWTILDTRLTDDGRLCAETTRVAWFTIVLVPEDEEEAA